MASPESSRPLPKLLSLSAPDGNAVLSVRAFAPSAALSPTLASLRASLNAAITPTATLTVLATVLTLHKLWKCRNSSAGFLAACILYHCRDSGGRNEATDARKQKHRHIQDYRTSTNQIIFALEIVVKLQLQTTATGKPRLRDKGANNLQGSLKICEPVPCLREKKVIAVE